MSGTKDALAAFIRWVMRDVTYHKHYMATVQKQAGDKVDVKLDDDSVGGPGGISGVPISYGLPGVKATVAPGTKVTLFFENGDPTKPRVYSWEGGHITLSFAEGTMPFARVGDTVNINPLGLVGYLSTPITGAATGTIASGAPTVTG